MLLKTCTLYQWHIYVLYESLKKIWQTLSKSIEIKIQNWQEKYEYNHKKIVYSIKLNL